MSPSDAAKLLELPDTATPEQIEARFLELRTKLEEKIGKAPTPGLKAKYRESLEEITAAFETLTLAADSSSLPVLKKESGNKSQETSAQPLPSTPQSAVHNPQSTARPSTSPSKKSGSKEFALVAVIAVVVLGAGGWWVMKTKAENEEKVRIAAEAKAEAERQVQLAKEQAERDRLAKEAADKAEKERVERLFSSLRSRMAELNVGYEAAMRAEQVAERELSELKNQERELARDQKTTPTPALRRLAAQVRAHDRLVGWLRENLPTHSAKVARARAEEMISARDALEAPAAVDFFASGLQRLQEDIRTQRAQTVVAGKVTIESNLPGASWTLRDAWGQEFSGTVPASLPEVASGPLTVAFRHEGLKELETNLRVEAGRNNSVTGKFAIGSLALEANLASASWELKDAHGFVRTGQVPARLDLVPQGRATVVFRKTGWSDIAREIDVTADAGVVRVAFPVGAVRLTSEPAGAEVFQAGKRLGRTPLTLEDLPPGPASWRLALTGRKNVTLASRIEAGRTTEASATLAPSRTTDVPALLATARAEFAKITSADERLAAARGMVAVLGNFSGTTPDDARFWVGAHLAAARSITSLVERFLELRHYQDDAARLDENSSRLWFDEMANAATQIPASQLWSDRLRSNVIGGSFELHPEPVRRVLLHAASAAGRRDEDWIHLCSFAAKLAALGFDAEAQRLASRADSLTSANYSKDDLAKGRREYRERPLRLALLRRNAEQARAEQNRLSAADRAGGAYWRSNEFALIGDFTTAIDLLGSRPSGKADSDSWMRRVGHLLDFMAREGDTAGFQRLIETRDIAAQDRLAATYTLAARYLEYGRLDQARALVEGVGAASVHVSPNWQDGEMLGVLCATGHQAKALALVQKHLDRRKNPGEWIDPVALVVAGDLPGFTTMLKGTEKAYRWIMLLQAVRLLGFQGRFEEAGALLDANRSHPEAAAQQATLLSLHLRRQGLGEADDFLDGQSPPILKMHALAAVIATLKDQATLRRIKSDLLPPTEPNPVAITR